MSKSKQFITKLSITKLSAIYTNTAKIWALSLGNIGEYDFFMDEDVVPEKGLLKKLLQSKDLNIGH